MSEGAAAQPCFGALVSQNQIGPSGTSAAGTWADGLSIACTGTVVTGNVITDATDGGIVLFARGLQVYNNTIVANTRTLLGGINMVDTTPYQGNFTGTLVQNNVIFSNTTMIKIGFALGPLAWGSNPNLATNNGAFQSNILTSGPTGYFGFGS